jgi:hypothetical protein
MRACKNVPTMMVVFCAVPNVPYAKHLIYVMPIVSHRHPEIVGFGLRMALMSSICV